ncbi:PREDICTED: uncharacterized protein LOC102027173 [Chinchilla lanigera]|uniref:uncharacterized protein LOC102027173 n=1 Tax=Chinchilla lanigera TaxID=34839 RepID=UPI000697A458|nr:PREDICTED: uncharacterized protein LOC102027173 [Chinchilla lanigera]
MNGGRRRLLQLAQLHGLYPLPAFERRYLAEGSYQENLEVKQECRPFENNCMSSAGASSSDRHSRTQKHGGEPLHQHHLLWDPACLAFPRDSLSPYLLQNGEEDEGSQEWWWWPKCERLDKKKMRYPPLLSSFIPFTECLMNPQQVSVFSQPSLHPLAALSMGREESHPHCAAGTKGWGRIVPEGGGADGGGRGSRVQPPEEWSPSRECSRGEEGPEVATGTARTTECRKSLDTTSLLIESADAPLRALPLDLENDIWFHLRSHFCSPGGIQIILWKIEKQTCPWCGAAAAEVEESLRFCSCLPVDQLATVVCSERRQPPPGRMGTGPKPEPWHQDGLLPFAPWTWAVSWGTVDLCHYCVNSGPRSY